MEFRPLYTEQLNLCAWGDGGDERLVKAALKLPVDSMQFMYTLKLPC